MKFQLKIEEFAMMSAAIYFMLQLEYSWWWFLLFALGPDISMLGYLVNTKIGAYAYNLFHHKGVALICIFLGLTYVHELYVVGLILFGHSSLDRIFGYGLKYEDDFKHTHLGWLKGQES
ncbi:MAG: DUF4260 domain-containing protein [Bacteroidia bacterium]